MMLESNFLQGWLVNPENSIWYYYKTLTCAVVEDGNRFLVIVSLPLLDIQRVFDVYKIFNIPVVYKNTSMTATYKLESNYVAINTEGTHFNLLNDDEALQCNKPAQKFCAPRSPIYALVNYIPCVMALFGRADMVNTKCNKLLFCKEYKLNRSSVMHAVLPYYHTEY